MRSDEETVSVCLPAWLFSAVDAEASLLAIQRHEVIKTWLAEKARALEAQRRSSGTVNASV